MSWHRLLWQLDFPKGAGRKPAEATPGACRNRAPPGRPQSHRGEQGAVGAWPACRQQRVVTRLGLSKETLPGSRASERALRLDEPAPSVGFKRPLSAPESPSGPSGCPWGHLACALHSHQLPSEAHSPGFPPVLLHHLSTKCSPPSDCKGETPDWKNLLPKTLRQSPAPWFSVVHFVPLHGTQHGTHSHTSTGCGSTGLLDLERLYSGEHRGLLPVLDLHILRLNMLFLMPYLTGLLDLSSTQVSPLTVAAWS